MQNQSRNSIKIILSALFIIIGGYFVAGYGLDLYQLHFTKLMIPMPPPTAGIEAGPLKVVITEDTTWPTVIKLICTILATYLGIRLINKLI